MTIKEYIEIIVTQCSKYRIINFNDEIKKIENHFIDKLSIPLSDKISESYKHYIFKTFEEEYIYHYEHKKGEKDNA